MICCSQTCVNYESQNFTHTSTSAANQQNCALTRNTKTRQPSIHPSLGFRSFPCVCAYEAVYFNKVMFFTDTFKFHMLKLLAEQHNMVVNVLRYHVSITFLSSLFYLFFFLFFFSVFVFAILYLGTWKLITKTHRKTDGCIVLKSL